MAAILEAGLRIPRDIAVVGCGNIQHAAYKLVPLTSVDQNTRQLGKTAAFLALSELRVGKKVIDQKKLS
jgi:LacI family transcriptional regulator